MEANHLIKHTAVAKSKLTGEDHAVEVRVQHTY